MNLIRGRCTGEISAHLAREAYQAGVLLSAGTDDDPNWDDPNSALDTELALLVDKVGMTPLDALRSATLIGARAAGQEIDAGSVEVGKLANLVVLSKNPLLNIANIRSIFMVVKRGVRFPRSAYKPATSKEMKKYVGVNGQPGSAQRAAVRSAPMYLRALATLSCRKSSLHAPVFISNRFGRTGAWQYQTMSTIHPISGTSVSSCHHPLRFVSCSLRALTAMDGRKVARL